MNLDQRVDNILNSTERCKVFKLDVDSNWTLTLGRFQGVKLSEFTKDNLLEILDEIQANILNYKTQRNIIIIKKEFLL